MRIVFDSLGKEKFMDICISKKEHRLIQEYMVVAKKEKIAGEEVSVGIKLDLEEKNESFWD